jgi:U3 small nucleolar RNA-associated protein 10
MVSSLAAQLAQNASLNRSLLVDRSRRGSSESYLFTGREADQHDLESIYALGYNGLLQLMSMDAEFEEYEFSLFSSAAKTNDRTLLSYEEDAQLHATISSFLLALGPYLLEAPAGKVLEWLVRRFRCASSRFPFSQI